MKALAKSAQHSKRGGQNSTGPKPGSGVRDSKARAAVDAGYAARQAAMLDAMIAYSQPGDKEYSSEMEQIYDLVNAGQALHVRMVEAYEDGLFLDASRFARLAAECGYALSDCHARLAAAFETIIPYKSHHFDAVHPHDRHSSNVTNAERLTRDRFIDDEFTGGKTDARS